VREFSSRESSDVVRNRKFGKARKDEDLACLLLGRYKVVLPAGIFTQNVPHILNSCTDRRTILACDASRRRPDYAHNSKSSSHSSTRGRDALAAVPFASQTSLQLVSAGEVEQLSSDAAITHKRFVRFAHGNVSQSP
jgi:hypothetical protein